MSHSKGVITASQQLAYLAQWLQEMSEMQTQDFLKCLLDKYSTSGHRVDGQVINGFTQLGVSDRPASIFQCRMKLFSEWFAQWSDEEKEELLIRLRNVNSKFMDEFQGSLESGVAVNGSAITDDDYQSHNLNGNIDDDSKTTEQLVMNGIHSDLSPESTETETIVVEKSVIAEEPKQDLDPPQEVEQENDAQEVIADKEVVTEEVVDEVMTEEVHKSDELIVNGIESNPSSTELQEVVG